MSVFPIETASGAICAAKRWNTDKAGVSDTLEISELRTYDCALEILDAYKLTGNFPVDLEIVLKDLGVLGQVTFEIKPKSLLSDCRQVEFLANDTVHVGTFNDIMRAIKDRIGFGPPLWTRLFRTALERCEKEIQVR